MTTDVKDQILSFIVSTLIGVGVFYATTRLGAQGGESVAMAVVAGLGAHMIFDRLAYRRKLDQAKREIISTLRVGHPFEAGFTIYKKKREASDYLNSALINAVSVWNTRLGKKIDAASANFDSFAANQDGLVLDVLRRGGDVRTVYEPDETTQASQEAFVAEARNALQDPRAGTFEVYEVDMGYAPVQQMIIVEYKDGSMEALVGWSVGQGKSFNYAVCLFRDPPIVKFYRDVFEEYTKYVT